jgi:hypothetical protein
MKVGDRMEFQDFEKAMNEGDSLQPVVLISSNAGSGYERGVAIRIGESLSKKWQSGDVMVFWPNGDHTTMHPDDEIEIIRLDLYESDR